MGLLKRLTTVVKYIGGNDSALYELHPELRYRQHVYSTTADTQPEQGGYKQAARTYTSHVWVNKAVRSAIADNIAPLPLRVVDTTGQPLERHPLTLALSAVNPVMASSDLNRQWCIDMMLGGEQGWEIVRGRTSGQVMEIWPRQPSQITVRVDKARRRYYGVQGYRISFDAQDEGYNLDTDELVHFKFYNPLNPWRGIAPIHAVRTGVVIDQLAQAWSRRFFGNQARPDYAVVAPEGITSSEREALEVRLMEKYGGLEGAHRPIVLEEGITDIKTFSFAPKDTEWIEQRKMSRDEIGAIFGVPDEVMGYGRDTYENFTTALTMLWTVTLRSLFMYRDDVLTEHFRRTGDLENGLRIATDTSSVAWLREDFDEKLDQAERLYRMGYPANVINDRLGLGMPDIDGGNEPFSGGGTAGQPAAFPQQQRHVGPPPVAKQSVPQFGSQAHERRMKQLDERQEPHAERMQRKLKRELQRQQTDITRRLRNQRSIGRGLNKPPHEVKQDVNELFDRDAEIEAFITAFRDDIENMVSDAAIQERLDLLQSVETLPTFDIERPEVQAAIEEVLQEMAEQVNDTTYRQLVDLFQEAESEGESIPEIMERLSAYFEGRKSDASTERIARTTMTGADTSGSLQYYRQSGVVEGSAWVAALDSATRPAHRDAHGQEQPLGETFSVGGEDLRYPGDPRGAAGNIINCRCGVIPILDQ